MKLARRRTGVVGGRTGATRQRVPPRGPAAPAPVRLRHRSPAAPPSHCSWNHRDGRQPAVDHGRAAAAGCLITYDPTPRSARPGQLGRILARVGQTLGSNKSRTSQNDRGGLRRDEIRQRRRLSNDRRLRLVGQTARRVLRTEDSYNDLGGSGTRWGPSVSTARARTTSTSACRSTSRRSRATASVRPIHHRPHNGRTCGRSRCEACSRRVERP